MNELSHLSCPFTWKMEELPRSAESLIDADSERREMLLFDGNRQDGITFRKLMYAVTKVYDFAENHCLENAMEEVEISENLFNDLQEKIPNGISIKAVEHMVKGTKCFILQKMNKLNDVESILETLSICEDSFELGTLHGCQSAAWYFYKFAGKEKAVENALIGVELNPKSGLWHYLLAKSLKRVRRIIGKEIKQSPKEQAALETAFKLQPDPLIGIQCAKMYHNLRENEKPKEMCNNVLDMNPTSCIIYLQLALGFIRYHNSTWDKLIRKQYSEKTRICLDYVGARMPENERYLHYKGIYLDKCLNDSEGALHYFENAGAYYNIISDFSYISLQMRITHNRYNAIPYLKNMLKRYEKFDEYTIQKILMNIGSFYHFVRKDTKSACESFLKCIEINPQCKQLKMFFYGIINKRFNTFDLLKTDILPKLQRQYPDKVTYEMITKAEEFYNLYGDKDSISIKQKVKSLQL